MAITPCVERHFIDALSPRQQFDFSPCRISFITLFFRASHSKRLVGQVESEQAKQQPEDTSAGDRTTIQYDGRECTLPLRDEYDRPHRGNRYREPTVWIRACVSRSDERQSHARSRGECVLEFRESRTVRDVYDHHQRQGRRNDHESRYRAMHASPRPQYKSLSLINLFANHCSAVSRWEGAFRRNLSNKLHVHHAYAACLPAWLFGRRFSSCSQTYETLTWMSEGPQSAAHPTSEIHRLPGEGDSLLDCLHTLIVRLGPILVR
jgi:hypothetical protein